MKNNDIPSLNLNNENKDKNLFKLSQKSPNNMNRFNPNKLNQNIMMKEAEKKIKENNIKRHGNNLNSFSIESNTLQNLINRADMLNTNYNYLNNNTQIKNLITQYPSSKTNRTNDQNKNNIKKKPTVNLSKKTEEIIRRRQLDKKIERNNSKKRNKDKKIPLTNSKPATFKEFKKLSSLKKKGATINKNNNYIHNRNITNKNNENENENSEKDENYNKKYFETKRVSISFEKDKMGEESIENDDEDEEQKKIYNISTLNYNTEDVNNEKKYKISGHSNSLRGANYDYDSCFEDDFKSQKGKCIKSQSRSFDKNEYNNYTYDTINPDNIDNNTKKSSQKEVNQYISLDNEKNSKENININIKETNKEKKEEINIENIENIENNGILNKTKDKDKYKDKEKVNINNDIIYLNNSTVNTDDFSANTNTNLTDNNNFKNGEKNNLSNNSNPKIDKNKNEVENIKNIISTTVKNINLNLDNSDIFNKEKQNNNTNKDNYILTEIKDNKNDLLLKNLNNNNNKNDKINIYAPKKIVNYFHLKTNHNNNNNNNNNDNNEIKNDINHKNENENDENINNTNEAKEKTINSQRRITYSKKLAPSNIFFQKNKSNSNNKKCKNQFKNIQTEIKSIKPKKYVSKLNSSFEGTKNLQMNNIFMNNNIFNNNFNYQYRDTNSLINPELSNNYYYHLNNNTTNNLIYEINKPSQIFFKLNNNSTKNVNKMQFFNVNNSINNYNNNNFILPINNDNLFHENINNTENEDVLLNNINFEDFIILEQKLNDIKYTLSGKNLIINECFEYLNYYYNSTIYRNIDDLFINYIDINDLKICLGYNILSIMICYNCSLDINIFEQTHLLVKEILDSNYKNLILLYEHILKNLISNNRINIRNNLWLLKIKNIINNYKNYEEKNTYNEYISLNRNIEMTNIEKIKINTNFIMNNSNIILTNIKAKNNEQLLTFFKSMNEKLYENIFFYFFKYILNIINFQGSIVGITLIQNHFNNINIILPYIKTKNIKKYSLVLDLEETLLHFNLNINNNNEGIVDIRPGTIKFLDDISEYYELIVFNEGEQKYTDLLIDSIEENKIYFEHRFYREHIIIDNNDIVKDLNRIGRALDKTLIIDNMAQNYKFQKNNGILIKSFWGDNRNDNILNNLSIILIKIAKDGGDIRNGLIKYKNEIVNKITIGKNNL